MVTDDSHLYEAGITQSSFLIHKAKPSYIQ